VASSRHPREHGATSDSLALGAKFGCGLRIAMSTVRSSSDERPTRRGLYLGSLCPMRNVEDLEKKERSAHVNPFYLPINSRWPARHLDTSKEKDRERHGGRMHHLLGNMEVGEEAMLLPCNHFFHGQCITPRRVSGRCRVAGERDSGRATD
jgi:hypothetical protein